MTQRVPHMRYLVLSDVNVRDIAQLAHACFAVLHILLHFTYGNNTDLASLYSVTTRVYMVYSPKISENKRHL